MKLNKKYIFQLVVLLFVWTLLWIPISNIFKSHPHFPSALLAPITVFLVFYSFESIDFAYDVLPFLVFWGGLLFFSFSIYLYNNSYITKRHITIFCIIIVFIILSIFVVFR